MTHKGQSWHWQVTDMWCSHVLGREGQVERDSVNHGLAKGAAQWHLEYQSCSCSTGEAPKTGEINGLKLKTRVRVLAAV